MWQFQSVLVWRVMIKTYINISYIHIELDAVKFDYVIPNYTALRQRVLMFTAVGASNTGC
jgi:hypothetical protein